MQRSSSPERYLNFRLMLAFEAQSQACFMVLHPPNTQALVVMGHYPLNHHPARDGMHDVLRLLGYAQHPG